MNTRDPFRSRNWTRGFWFALCCAVLLLPWRLAAEYGDVVLNERSEQEWVPPVVFPHWFHRVRFRCSVCHGELDIEMKVGATPMDMGALSDGKYCGACHDGQTAWGLEECVLCHSGLPGLRTGIRGGHETGGPGRW